MKWARAFVFAILALLSPLAASQTADECLASALHYEARTDSFAGRRAVLDVIYNRMAQARKGACWTVRRKQQFSWHPSKPFLKMTPELKNLLTLTRNHPKMLFNGETYFFHRSIRPRWSRKMSCSRIESHMFCYIKEKK